MTASTSSPVAATGTARTVLLLAAAAVVVSLADGAVALAGLAAGADPAFPPLGPAVFVPFGIAGLAAGFAGWCLVRRFVPRPAPALRVLVPVLLVLSWAPDVAVALTRAIPGTTTTGMVALGIMHLVVVGTGVPVYRLVAPVR